MTDTWSEVLHLKLCLNGTVSIPQLVQTARLKAAYHVCNVLRFKVLTLVYFRMILMSLAKQVGLRKHCGQCFLEGQEKEHIILYWFVESGQSQLNATSVFRWLPLVYDMAFLCFSAMFQLLSPTFPPSFHPLHLLLLSFGNNHQKNGRRGKLGQDRLKVRWEAVMFLFNLVIWNVWLFLFEYLAKCFVEVVVIMFGFNEGRFCWGCFACYDFRFMFSVCSLSLMFFVLYVLGIFCP